MLEHPTALRVAGDATTMFFRRWTPAGSGGVAVPWKLEAYSWGGLTESPLVSAAWLLFAPFMLYNVAHFALPPQQAYDIEPGGRAGSGTERFSRDRWHASAAALLRLLAFSATLQFTTAVVSILVSSAALQAPNAHFPSWLSWYAHWATGYRVGLAMAGVAVVIALMWLVSVKTEHRYEARVSRPGTAVRGTWLLTQPGFWRGQELVRRQRSLHAGGALAVTALIVARPVPHPGGGRLAVLAASASVLALIAVTLCLRLADRHNVTLADQPRVTLANGPGSTARAVWWCRMLLYAGAAAFIGALFTSGWPAENAASHVALPGFTNATAFLLGAQALLAVVLALVVWKLARSAPEQDARARPFCAGHLTTVLAVLAVCLGGVFSAVTALFAARVLGTPVPSGPVFSPPPANALEIPWPLYTLTAAPLGLAAGMIIAAAWMCRTWIKHASAFAATGPGKRSEVASFYGTTFGDPDAPGYKGSRKRIARAWATGKLTDQAGVVAVWAAAGMVAAIVWADVYAARASRHLILDQNLHGFAAIESLVGLFLAGVLVGVLRSDYSDPSKRKTIGALWDIGTFWPRAAHPFAPPCYAERAVPELADRIRILTGKVAKDDDDPAWLQIQAHQRNADDTQPSGLSIPAGPVLLTGYSQGSVITAAVVAQLPDDARERIALLTLACPARRLYGRAFPAYFGMPALAALADLLDGGHPGPRWKNLVRRTDYIGSWIFAEPGPGQPGPVQVHDGVDQPCWDPVTITADADPTPPPIHSHPGFWPDPRVTQLGRRLGSAIPRDLPRPGPAFRPAATSR
jgi:hypothetical protein